MKIVFLFFLSLSAYSKVNFTWLGTTGVYLTDSQTSILFDPVVSRFSLLDMMFDREVKTDDSLVKTWLKKIHAKNVKGIFISHTHFDHAFDAASFTKQTGATLYGTSSAINIGLGGGVSPGQLKKVGPGEIIHIGRFKIHVIESVHSPLFFKYQIMTGEIEKPLSQPTAARNYKMGGALCFYIEHPDGNIFFLPMSRRDPKKDHILGKKAKVVFQGIASRESTFKMLGDLTMKPEPKIVIPLHFDDFFEPLSNGLKKLGPVHIEEFQSTMNKLYPDVQVLVPEYGKFKTILP